MSTGIADQELTARKAGEIAAVLYGQMPAVERFWSVVNNVYLLRFRKLPDRVMKGARSKPTEIFREQAVIPALACMGLPVPPIEKTQADFPHPCPAFTIMPRIGGRNLGERYHAGDDRVLMRSLFRKIGLMLADLHELPAQAVPGGLDEQAGRERAYGQLSAASDRIRQCPVTVDRLEEALVVSRRWLEEESLSFTHGDCHPHNVVLAEDNRFAAIDWGGAGAGFSWADLGRCLAITGLFFGDWQWIREGYLAKKDMSPEVDLRVRTWMCLTLLEAGSEALKDPDSPKARQILAEVRRELPVSLR